MRAPILLLLVAVPLAAACGGHSPTTPASSGTDTLTDVPYLTGTATRDPYGNSFFYNNTDMLVGDEDGYEPGLTLRGIVTFNMKAVPQNATIETATLQLAQCVDSGAPFPSLGNVVIDHVPLMTTPDSAIYDTTAVNAGIAVLSSSSTLGLKDAPVTSSVAADRAAGDTLIQLRLRFSVMDGNNNGVSDYVGFSADSLLGGPLCPYVTGNHPLLIVTFQ
jgi:hypothetical protein